MHPSLRFALLLFAIALALLAPLDAPAQDGRTRAVQVHATTQASPAQITLHWETSPHPVELFYVHRRVAGSNTWVYLGNDPAPNATSFTDTNVTPGVRYEYRVYRQYDASVTTAHARGYTIAGINASLLDQRGTVILLVDSTQQAALASEITRFQRDLAGDGWTVVLETAAPTDSPPSVRAKLQAIYNAAPSNVKAAILLGRIPVPYSGDLMPDGHTDHQGAWPADTYYADLTGTWTDATVDRTTASQARNHNVPGDGKFDQSNLPSDANIAIGRIDMANLSGFSAGANQTELLRNYLRKNHEFRHRLGAFADIPRRGLIRDGFGFLSSEAPASVAWRGFAPMFGPANIQTTSNLLNTLETNKYLWAYGAGAGGYTSASGIGTSADFKTRDSLAVFNMMFGSYFGDWDSPTDNFLRAPLAGTPGSLALVNTWGNRPDWHVHGMTLGETIGDAYLRTVNNPSDWNPNWTTGYFTYYTSHPRMVHIALMGDPTLRLHPVAAPASAAAPTRTPGVSSDSIQLSWAAPSPAETGLLGYHVYRSASLLGPYTRLTSSPVSTLHYTDSLAPKTALHYQVRAVVTTTSASGTYQNAGQALFLSVPLAPPGATPDSLTATALSATVVRLAWTYPATDADQFIIQRRLSGTGTWSDLATLDGTLREFFDASANAATAYDYRVVAANPLGTSPASGTASATTFSPNVLVHDPFTDGGVTNGPDLLDVAWSRTDANPSNTTFTVVQDPLLDPFAPHHVAELHIDAVATERYLYFPLPQEVQLGVGEGLRLSFRLRHTDTPRNDVSSTAFSLAHTPTNSPWANANNREYWVRTSYGAAGTLGTIRKSVGLQIANTGTALRDGTASINAGTDAIDVSLEVTRTDTSRVRIRYQLNNGAVQEAFDDADVITAFNRVFFRFRTRADAASPAFRLDNVRIETIPATPTIVPGPGVIEFTAPVFTTTEPVFTGTTASQTKTVTITARRSGGNEGAVSVDYVATAIESLSFAGENYNTGTGGVWREYQSSRPQVNDGAGTLSWAHGESGEKSFSFTINADIIFTNFVPAANNLVEGIESLELFLARPKGGATLGALSRARLDILDAQAPAGGQGVIQFERPRFAAFENAGTMPVVLRRVQGSTGAVSAVFTTSSSLLGGYGGAFSNPITPAVAGGDYTSVSQTVTWADGDSSDKIVHVPLIDNAAVQSATGSRGVRGIRFQLSAPSGGALTSVNEALGLILDDESEIYDVWIENLYGKLMSVRLPRHTPVVRGLVHFMPGTGGDWRPQVLSPSHQAVADQWGFAISGQNANSFASTGPGGVAEFHNHLDALALFTGRPELRNAPVVFTGFSAGGYASAASHGAVPDQTLGFVAHKGGSYEFRGTSQADTKPPIHETNLFTPGLLIVGGNDGTVPAQDLYNAFLQYRQTLPPGSQVSTAIDWNVGHTDTGGQGWAMTYLFIDELIRLRYPAGQLPGQGPGEIVDLHRIPHADTWLVQQVNGFLGNRRPDPALAPRNLQIRPAAGVADPGTDGIVLSSRLARAVQAFSSLHANTYQSSVPFQSPLRITSHSTTHNQISQINLGQSTTLTLDPRGYTNFNRADFYFDNQLVGTRSAAPWSVTFTPPTSGVGLLRVVTSTNGGGETRYAFETLLVRDIPPYPPAAPTGLVATRPTASTASLTWTTVPFATGLQVQRSTAGAAGPWTTVANLDGGATTWSDANLVATASYWYRLVATNPYGNSPASTVALLLVETPTTLVHDPFSDGGVTNGADPQDVAWSITGTGNTLAVVTDTTLDPASPHRVAEFSINTTNKDEYATFALPSAVSLAVDEGLRVSFRLRHTGTPRSDASATGVSLAFTPNASSAPWNNANNREYFFITSYGSTTAQGAIRKTGTGGAQLLNVGTQTLATGLASINAGTDVATVSLEVFRTGENSVRIRYRLNNGPAQEVTDNSDIVTTFNRVFLRFRTRTDAAAPAFRLDDVTVQRLTPAIATPRQLWRATHFTAAQLANPALEADVWGDQADPDGDGLPNLLEYALGLDPTAPSGTGIPAAALNPAGTQLQLTFHRARAELTYEVLASSDLVTWTVIATNPGNAGQTVTVTDPEPASPRRFLRLRVQ